MDGSVFPQRRMEVGIDSGRTEGAGRHVLKTGGPRLTFAVMRLLMSYPRFINLLSHRTSCILKSQQGRMQAKSTTASKLRTAQSLKRLILKCVKVKKKISIES